MTGNDNGHKHCRHCQGTGFVTVGLAHVHCQHCNGGWLRGQVRTCERCGYHGPFIDGGETCPRCRLVQ